MKRFRFRAATVLDLRRREHEMAQAQLARAQQERDAAAGALRVAEQAADRARHDYRQEIVKGAAAAVLERHRNWILHQHAEADDRRRVLAERLVTVEQAVTRVRHTHRQVRVLERLRERLLRRYEEAARRQEGIEMDLFANIQYARRMGGGID